MKKNKDLYKKKLVSKEEEHKKKKQETELKEFNKKIAEQKKLTKKYSKKIIKGELVSKTGHQPDLKKYAIELYNIEKSYVTGQIVYKVLKEVNLKINKGQFVVILGPSGSGKTTLLNIMSGLDKAVAGDAFVEGYNLTYLLGKHLTDFRRDVIGFIFQMYNLLPMLSARENAEVGENLAKVKNPELSLERIFEMVGMTNDIDKRPQELSGGQQQRVSIARAISKNPRILFCDEPTGALDEHMGKVVLKILKKVNSEYHTTVIMVTHNPNIAKIADFIIHVKDGKITEQIVNTNPEDPEKIDWA